MAILTKNSSSADWLDQFALSSISTKTFTTFTTFTKLSSTMDLMGELTEWNFLNQNTEDFSKFSELRTILGQIYQRQTQMTNLIKTAFMRPSSIPTLSSQAQEYIGDAQSYPQLVGFLEETERKLQSTASKITTTEYDGSYYTDQEARESNQKMNMLRTLNYLIHSIKSVNLSQNHIEFLSNIAAGDVEDVDERMSEVDEERQAYIQRHGMYSFSDQSELTLKIIREVLQNSTDAVMHKNVTQNEAHIPTIKIRTNDLADDMMDLVIEDNGVGMDLDTLRQKFYIWWATGKESQEGTTGGLGIGKRLILESPEEGWSVRTNDIYSNKALRDLYLSRYKKENEEVDQPSQEYLFPELNIQKQGTSLAIYKIPEVSNYKIKALCSRYATSPNLNIVLDGEAITPSFSMNDLVGLDSSGSAIVDTMAENEFQSSIIQTMLTEKSTLDGLGDLSYHTDGGESTSIELFLNKTESSGSLFVLINGQYQFDEMRYFPNTDVICNIRTTVNPGEPDYPMTPSRDSLRDPYKSDVNNLTSSLKELLRNIADSQVFADGLNIAIFNEDASPLSTQDEDEGNRQEMTKDLMGALGQRHSSFFTDDKLRASDIAEVVERTSQFEDDPKQKEILQKTQAVLSSMGKDAKIESGDVENIIEGLMTPCYVQIQKGFVSANVAHERPELTKSLIILWKTVIERVVKQSAFFSTSYYGKEYVPGLIFSDQALALYSPPDPKLGTDHHCISINPISIAALINPDRFEKIVNRHGVSTFEDTQSLMSGESEYAGPKDTPTKRLTRFIMHEAIHEVTHLLFPDGYGSDNFHKSISKMEILCAPLLDEIRSDVKKFMQPIKSESNDLMSAMKFDLRAKKSETTEAGSFSFRTKTGAKKKMTITKAMWLKAGRKSGWIE